MITGRDTELKAMFHADTGIRQGSRCEAIDRTVQNQSPDILQLVQLFRKAGGIPFCKTNVPQVCPIWLRRGEAGTALKSIQAMLAFECSNPVFGRTTNPYDSARGPGGSSGGEAALVALAGTPFGWGTDGELIQQTGEGS